MCGQKLNADLGKALSNSLPRYKIDQLRRMQDEIGKLMEFAGEFTTTGHLIQAIIQEEIDRKIALLQSLDGVKAARYGTVPASGIEVGAV